MAYTQFTKNMNIISPLNDRPNALGNPPDNQKLSAADLKGKFDEGGLAIKDYINNTLLPELNATAGSLATDEEAISQNTSDITALKAKMRFLYADDNISYENITSTTIMKAKVHPDGEVGAYIIGKNGGVARIIASMDSARWIISTQQMQLKPTGYSASEIIYQSNSPIYDTQPDHVSDALTGLEGAVSTLQGKPSFVYFKGIISNPNDTLPVYTQSLDWFYPNAIEFGVFVDQQGNIGEITDITGTTVSFHSLAKHITSLPERIPYQSMSSIYDTQPACLDDALTGLEAAAETMSTDIDNKEAMSNVAGDYDNTATYSVGDYCHKDGVLYRCTTAITTAESWTAAHWTSTTVGADLKADASLTVSGAAADAKVSGDKIKEISDLTLENAIATTQKSETVTTTFTDGYMDASGVITSSTSYHYTEKLSVKKGDIFSTAGNSIRFVTAFSGNTVISDKGVGSITNTYTVPEGIDGIVITLYSGATTITKTYYPIVKINAMDSILENKDVVLFSSLNRFDVSAISESTILNSSGNGTSENNSYNTSDYIYVGDLSSVKIYRNSTPVLYNAYYVLFDKSKQYLGSRAVNNTIDTSTAEFIRISYSKTESYIQVVDGSKTVSFFSAYVAPVEKRDSTRLEKNEADIALVTLGNVLTGKKWVACGDSFTEGYFDGESDPEDMFIMSGKYTGQKRVYPFIIGNRNDMDIVNEAVSGSTMCLNDGTHNAFSTENGRYTQIPADADYITLYFGINDVNYSSPLGTISDEDNTTFYGAWNVVLAYLIEHHPLAKIGIIITNGASVDVMNAEIAIAKKWGISYYDMNGLPLMLRSFNQDASAEVKALRNEAFRVSASNLHPNGKAHEYESTCIELWLRSL